MPTNPEIHLQEAVESLKEPSASAGFLQELYQQGSHAAHSAWHSVEEHPALTTGVVITGAVLLFMAIRGESKGAEQMLEKRGEERFFPKITLDKSVAQAAEREAVLKQVGPIPEVQRPLLASPDPAPLPEQFARAARDYRVSLANLRLLPASYTLLEGDDIQAIARKILESRTAVTGERLFADVLNTEAQRLSERNPDLILQAGRQITVYADNDWVKLAEKTAFKHVPQLGQFLKENGVTEEQISRALEIQKNEPQTNRRLIGQILTDEGLATKEQVDAAFAKQGKLKSVLAEVRKELGF